MHPTSSQQRKRRERLLRAHLEMTREVFCVVLPEERGYLSWVLGAGEDKFVNFFMAKSNEPDFEQLLKGFRSCREVDCIEPDPYIERWLSELWPNFRLIDRHHQEKLIQILRSEIVFYF